MRFSLPYPYWENSEVRRPAYFRFQCPFSQLNQAGFELTMSSLYAFTQQKARWNPVSKVVPNECQEQCFRPLELTGVLDKEERIPQSIVLLVMDISRVPEELLDGIIFWRNAKLNKGRSIRVNWLDRKSEWHEWLRIFMENIIDSKQKLTSAKNDYKDHLKNIIIDTRCIYCSRYSKYEDLVLFIPNFLRCWCIC